jgi:Ca2+-binding EF-hand superfamily protein
MNSQQPPHQQTSTNYKEAFSLFDKRGNGRVTIDSLGDLLRACGQNPTLSEIEDLKRSAGGNDCTYPPLNLIFTPKTTPREIERTK